MRIGRLAIGDGANVRVLSFDGASIVPVVTFSHGEAVNSVDWSPKGQFIAMGGLGTGNPQVRVLEFDGLFALTQRATFIHGSDRTIQSVAWSPSGQYVAIGGNSAGSDPEMRVLEFDPDLNTLASVADFVNDAVVRSVAWYPSGTQLVFGGDATGAFGHFEIRGLDFDPDASDPLTTFLEGNHGSTNILSVDVANTTGTLCIDCETTQIKGDLQVDGCVIEDLKIAPDKKLLTNFIDPVMLDGEGNCVEDPTGTTCFSGKAATPFGLLTNEITPVIIDFEGNCVPDVGGTVCIQGDLIVKGDFDCPPGPTGPQGATGPTGPAGPDCAFPDCFVEDLRIDPDFGLLTSNIDAVMIDPSTGECIQDPCGVVGISSNLGVDPCRKLLANFVGPVVQGSESLEADRSDIAVTCFSGNVGTNEGRSVLTGRVCPVQDVPVNCDPLCDSEDLACSEDATGCLELCGSTVIVPGRLLVNDFGSFACPTKGGLPGEIEPMRFGNGIAIDGDLVSHGINLTEAVSELAEQLDTQRIAHGNKLAALHKHYEQQIAQLHHLVDVLAKNSK